jgi:hypothetical protein
MSLLLGVEDQNVLESISKLLAEVNVKLVQVPEALEFCIEAYKTEGPGLPMLESREPPPPQDVPDEVITAAKLVPHALKEQLKALEPPPKQKTVETQTGTGVVPELSMAASLGKQALEVLRLKEPLSDWIITALIIEYLKQTITKEVLGWVVVNFPATFEQCRLFEASVS